MAEGLQGLDVPWCPHGPPAPSRLSKKERISVSFIPLYHLPSESEGKEALPGHPKVSEFLYRARQIFAAFLCWGRGVNDVALMPTSFLGLLPGEETFLFLTEVKVPGSLSSLAPNVCPRHWDKTLVPDPGPIWVFLNPSHQSGPEVAQQDSPAPSPAPNPRMVLFILNR